MNILIHGNLTTRILSIQMLNDPDAEQAVATVIPWAGGKYGEYRVATQTIRYRTVENGVEVFKPCKKTRYISWSNGYWGCS